MSIRKPKTLIDFMSEALNISLITTPLDENMMAESMHITTPNIKLFSFTTFINFNFLINVLIFFGLDNME